MQSNASRAPFPLPPTLSPALSFGSWFQRSSPSWKEGVAWQKSTHQGRGNQRKCPSFWLSPHSHPLLPHPGSHHVLVLPSFRACLLPWLILSGKQSGSLFMRELIPCTMALLLWTNHLSQRIRTNEFRADMMLRPLSHISRDSTGVGNAWDNAQLAGAWQGTRQGLLSFGLPLLQKLCLLPKQASLLPFLEKNEPDAQATVSFIRITAWIC